MSRAFKHCKRCTERYLGCHATCPKYKEDCDEWQKAKDYLDSDKEERKYHNSRTYRYLDWKAKSTKE